MQQIWLAINSILHPIAAIPLLSSFSRVVASECGALRFLKQPPSRRPPRTTKEYRARLLSAFTTSTASSAQQQQSWQQNFRLENNAGCNKPRGGSDKRPPPRGNLGCPTRLFRVKSVKYLHFFLPISLFLRRHGNLWRGCDFEYLAND
jgi:hypothetical protein